MAKCKAVTGLAVKGLTRLLLSFIRTGQNTYESKTK